MDVDILEHSFDLLAPRGDAVVDTFYRRLFAVAPDTRALFAADLAAQKRALLATLVVLRTSLRQLEAIVPALRALGARHRGYGVRPEQYPVVGTALLGAMAEVGGADWDPAYTAAWAAAYQVVQDIMLAGAAPLGECQARDEGD